MKKTSFYIGLPVQLFVFSILIFITTITISSYIFYQYSEDIYKNELENKIKDISILSSVQFDTDYLDELNNYSDFNKDEYQAVKSRLLSLTKNIDYVKYAVLIKRIDSDNAINIVDSSEKPYDFNKDGKIIPETEGVILLEDPSNKIKINNDPIMSIGFNEVSISNTIHRDEAGSYVRVYAPIGRLRNYLLALDIYNEKTSANKINLVEVIQNTSIVSLFVVILFGLIYSLILILPINKILRTSKQIQEGSFNNISLSPAYGEISKLADCINYFSDELKNSKSKEEETKRIIERKKQIIETTNKQLQQKNYELNNTILTLNRINQIVEELIAIKDTDKLMETVLKSTIEIINAEKGFIIKHNEDKSFSVIVSINTSNIDDEQELKFNEIPCLKTVFETMNYINIHDEGKFISEEFKNALVFPLIIENEIDGLLFIMNKKAEKEEKIYFTETDESTVRILSKLVSAVWESIKLFEMATVDSMSKLYVRRYFEKSLEEEIKSATKENYNLHVVMMDIDNLQKYNNKYGRTKGDRIIEKVAEIIKEELNEDILTARYGGDKFVGLITDSQIEDVKELADKIRERIYLTDFIIDDDITDNLSISIGISSFPKDAKTAEQLLRDSEMALYKSKQQGKNKITIF
ncbi:MAG: diguanylate cyclase [Candidatus Sericytochromatia bacterium]